MTSIEIMPKAFVVRFRDLVRWDPSSFHGIVWHWPDQIMVPIGSVLRPRKEKVDRSNFTFSELQPVTIHFDGTIDKRNISGDRAYSMDLFFAHSGDIIVAKIDLKNGAVAIVPDGWEKVVVTNHFAVYEPDRSKIVPEYFHGIIQVNFFKSYLWQNKVGAEGRKEVKLDFFEAIKIPLPPLSVQQAIVDYWVTSQNEISYIFEKLAGLETTAAKDILRDAGIVIKDLLKKPKAFYLQWKDFERWGVEFNRWEWSPKDLLLSSKYPMKPLSEIAYVNPTNNNENKFKEDEVVSFIPMDAVGDKAGEIATVQSRKYKDVKTGYTRFKERDILWAKITPCMQNGKFAIAKNLHKGTGFGSTEFHVVRSKNENVFLPEYAWLLLRLVHMRKAAQRYFIGSAGQQRVPADFLRELHIPLPPIDVQIAIVQKIMAVQHEMAHERKKAEQLSGSVKKEIEEMILGIRPVA